MIPQKRTIWAVGLIPCGPFLLHGMAAWRRRGKSRYLHPATKPALQETLGVILFQEPVLKLSRDVAGFSPGEGELLRRTLGHKRAGEQIESFRRKFLNGAAAQGIPQAIAELSSLE